MWWLAALLVFPSLSQTASHQEHVPVEVQTKLGKIRGQESIFLHKRVRSFLSVPFAEPPVGEGRFRPPRPKKPWNETVIADDYSPACYQGRDMYNSSFWGSEMWNHNTPVSEDCLYLNIWAPAEAYNLTVMVWLFGGGFYSGSPSLILYDGKALALTGNVVVVNINYRVGPFGYLFMDHEDAPGNMGMLDQQLALYWIRDNIFSFGGNPSRITLFGESAGAASIVAHLIAPSSQGLFKNGILQSGSLDNKWSMDSPARAMDKGNQLAVLTNCNKTEVSETIACMRELPAEELSSNIWSLDLTFLEFPFVIVSRDRHFFRDRDGFTSLRSGHYATNVDLMFGINHDEGNFWNIYNLPDFFDKQTQPLLSKDDMNVCVEKAFATQPTLVRNAAKFVYSDPNCTNPHEKTQFYAEQVNQMVGDYFFTCDSIWFADEVPKQNGHTGKVFVYYFDEPSSANPWPKWTGVMHGYEIEFVFGVPLYNQTAGYTKRERTLAEKVIQYWTSFANTGIPTLREEKSTDIWPEYDGIDNTRWMLLKGGSLMKPINRSKTIECDLWRRAKDIEYRKYVEEITSSSSLISILSIVPILLLSW
ncbi:unnamed protein product [Auanema sp. JU1783]|nr:unnamed protein product [Auanema sp. JU1783]